MLVNIPFATSSSPLCSGSACNFICWAILWLCRYLLAVFGSVILLLRELEAIDLRRSSILSLPAPEGPLTDLRLTLDPLLDGIREPMGLYSETRLFRRHEEPKLKASNFSLCSFLTGARYLGLGIGSSGR